MGVILVDVSIDGGAYSLATGTANWTFSLNTTVLSNAAHTITAKAWDSSGNSSTVSVNVTVNNSGPVLTTIALSPSTGSIPSGGTLQFAATGKDQNGNVMRGIVFAFSSTNTAVATINAAGLASGIGAGSSGIYASSGTVRSNMAFLAVADNVPPTIAISSPSSGDFVGPGDVTITATASDNLGVTSVQFLVDGVNLGAPVTSPPYTVVWNIKSLPNNGRHTLTAIASDLAGNNTTSSSVVVTLSKKIKANADVPGLRDAYAYPNPAVRQAPVVRALLGLVDSVDITIFDTSGRAVNSASLPGTPTGVTSDGDYYYDYVWPGAQASGVYFAVIRGKKSDGTNVRARVNFAVVR